MDNISTHAERTRKFGIILLLSALVLGLAFFLLVRTNSQENGNKRPPTSVKEAVAPEKTSKTAPQVQKDENVSFEKIEEPAGTPPEINNQTLEELDNDIKSLESVDDDLSGLEL